MWLRLPWERSSLRSCLLPSCSNTQDSHQCRICDFVSTCIRFFRQFRECSTDRRASLFCDSWWLGLPWWVWLNYIWRNNQSRRYAFSMITTTIRSQDHDSWEGSQRVGNSKQSYRIYPLWSNHMSITSEHQSHETLLPCFYEAMTEWRPWLRVNTVYSTPRRCHR